MYEVYADFKNMSINDRHRRLLTYVVTDAAPNTRMSLVY